VPPATASPPSPTPIPRPAAATGEGARAHAGLAALLDDPEVAAIYVSTPNHLHRPAVEAAAAAGKPVLCEKPMAATLADAEAMAEAVAAAGIRYGTAFDQRHHPAHALMRDLIAEGRIGRVTAIRIAYACWVDAGFAADNWRADPARAGGGALMDLAPHGLDLVDHLLGEPVVEVAALTQSRVQRYAVDDGAVLIGRTADGVLAPMHVPTTARKRCPAGAWSLGTRGQLLRAHHGPDAGGTARSAARLGLDARHVPDRRASPSRADGAFARWPCGRGGPSTSSATCPCAFDALPSARSCR
jgi:predicted dehydrogenase